MTSIEQVVAFNNEGVAHFKAGAHAAAWDLLKGALEIHRIQASDPTMTHRPVCEELRSNVFYLRALEQYESRHRVSTPLGERRACPPTPKKIQILTSDSAPSSDYLYLHTQPIALPSMDGKSIAELRRSAAIVVFNMALLTQVCCRTSQEVLKRYRLASQLLGAPSKLAVVILNNMAVWCVENDALDSARRCMEEVSEMLHTISPEDSHRQEIVANILWIFDPPTMVSPAA